MFDKNVADIWHESVYCLRTRSHMSVVKF